MAACSDGFEEWLGSELQALNTDQDIFGGYIKGILEGDETEEEKIEALEEILAEVSEDISSLCKEIVGKWTLRNSSRNADESSKFDVDAKIATILESQAQRVTTGKKITDEEKKYRDAIVAQYSQVSDDEDEHCDDLSGETSLGTASYGDSLARNTNVESVAKAEKDRKEKAKAEVEKKKAQEKASREKQKQQQQERKEKEKKRTQKGERKR